MGKDGPSDAALAVMRHRGDGPRFTRFGRNIFYKGQWLLDYFDDRAARDTAEADAKHARVVQASPRAPEVAA